MATKPTVNEYNRVYVGLRPYSGPDYDLLRTWILSLSEGAGIQNTTYADLLAAVNGATLTPGQIYCITDFRSRQLIPNTADVNLGGIEFICVQALTEDVLSQWAYSSDFQQDILVYDIFNTDFGADMGRILYRKDTTNNLEAWYDWRTFVYRRWQTIPLGGTFTVLSDNGNPFADFPTFGNDNLNCSIGENIRSGVGAEQSNIVLNDDCENVHISSDCTNSTFLAACNSVNVGSGCSLLTLLGSNVGIEIANAVSTVEIGASSGQITIGTGSSSLNIGTLSAGINFEDRCALCFVGDSNARIKFMTGVSSCSTADNTVNTVFSPGVVNRFAENANINCNTFHRPNFVEAYIEWDFATDGGAQGTYNLLLLPSGSAVVGQIFQGDTLVSGGLAEIATGIETDDPTGLIPSTVYTDAIFNGNINFSATTPAPNAPTAVNRYLIMTISVADMTSGLLRLWCQTAVNQN